MNILYELGQYGLILLIVLSWYLLWEHNNLFFYFTVGILANIILNLFLKGVFQEPRPLYDDKQFYLLKTHAKSFFFKDGIPFNFFGMPSGHAQMAFFITMFMYLSLKNKKLLYFYLILSLLICYQRVKFEYHSVLQVIVGSITGLLFGYFLYQLARGKITGKIREKPDDFGPI